MVRYARFLQTFLRLLFPRLAFFDFLFFGGRLRSQSHFLIQFSPFLRLFLLQLAAKLSHTVIQSHELSIIFLRLQELPVMPLLLIPFHRHLRNFPVCV